MVRLLLAGGGSVGHLSPCLAVAQECEGKPDLQTLIVCGSSVPERAILEGRKGRTISAPKLRRYFSLRTLLLPVEFLVSFTQSTLILLRFKPHAILATGGPVGMSACMAGKLLSVPIILFEPDATFGITTRLCRRFAKKVCLGQDSSGGEASPVEVEPPPSGGRTSPPTGRPEVRPPLRGSTSPPEASPRLIVTGMPVRKEILEGSEDAGRASTGFSGKRPVLLVLGGSQGAAAINAAVKTNLSALLDLCDVIHITGKGKAFPFKHARYLQREFVTGELPHLLALADIALTRAGANTLAELAAVGLPAIICPLPGSAQDHQRENAGRYAGAGAAVVLEEARLQGDLLPTIRSILDNEGEEQRMKDTMKALYKPDAAKHIAEILLGVVGSKR